MSKKTNSGFKSKSKRDFAYYDGSRSKRLKDKDSWNKYDKNSIKNYNFEFKDY